MSDLYLIFNFIAFTMGQFFNVLDNVYLGDYSYLTILTALHFLAITLWFIMVIMNPNDKDSNKEG